MQDLSYHCHLNNNLPNIFIPSMRFLFCQMLLTKCYKR